MARFQRQIAPCLGAVCVWRGSSPHLSWYRLPFLHFSFEETTHFSFWKRLFPAFHLLHQPRLIVPVFPTKCFCMGVFCRRGKVGNVRVRMRGSLLGSCHCWPSCSVANARETPSRLGSPAVQHKGLGWERGKCPSFLTPTEAKPTQINLSVGYSAHTHLHLMLGRIASVCIYLVI